MLARALLLISISLLPVHAEVTRIDIQERSKVLQGESIPGVGTYERIIGRAHFAVDPNREANKIIHDLEFAPRNADGKVEFSADLYVLTPSEPGENAGPILFDVVNRGGKTILGMIGAKGSSDPRQPEEFGDRLLLERGYTIVWLGWEFDLLPSAGRMTLDAPTAAGVTGWTRSHFSPDTPAQSFSVAGGGHAAYPALEPNDPAYRLIERRYQDGPGEDIPRGRWRFSDPQTVELDGGFAAGRTYDVIYRSKDPGIAGLGPAAIRDLVSFLKYGGQTEVAELGTLHEHLTHAMAFGSSQSGRFLRTFLRDGFNADEQGRIVFDGMWPHIAGAAYGSFTHRFAQPTRQDPYYTVEIFPFRDLPDEDPASGQNRGLLDRATLAGVVPKLVYTVTSSEYWNRSASLLHTTLDGKADAPLPDTTRIYYLAGMQHGSGNIPPGSPEMLEYRLNSNTQRPLARAILLALEAWVVDGKAPPLSRYPHVGELTPLAGLRFPAIRGLRTPGHQRRALPLDFGPSFWSAGIIEHQPPRQLGPPYAAKLPQLGADGNELGGIQVPALVAPLATYTGWNLYRTSVADADYSPGNSGATIPFAWTKAQRLEAGDPRPSIMERYKSRDSYRSRVKAAAESLRKAGFLLKRDLDSVVERNLALWDYLQKSAPAQ